MAQVPRTGTPISDSTLAPLLVTGLAQRIGSTPVRELAELILAQLWTENARGNPIQNNLGNLSAGGFIHGVEKLSWSGDFWRPSWFDQAAIDQVADAKKKTDLQTRHQQMLNGEIPSAFRAYADVAAGLSGYLDLLFKPVYHPLLAAAATGDPLAFATEIKAHYNPDKRYDPVATSRTFTSLVSEFRQKGLFDMLPKAAPAGPEPEQEPSSSRSDWVLSPSDVHAVGHDGACLFVLREGVKGPLVALLQTGLGAPVTGVFDAATVESVKQFQARHGLVADAVVGPKTWAVVIT